MRRHVVPEPPKLRAAEQHTVPHAPLTMRQMSGPVAGAGAGGGTPAGEMSIRCSMRAGCRSAYAAAIIPPCARGARTRVR